MRKTDKNQNKEIKILALGDSYTVGEGINRGSWPEQVAAKLKEHEFEVKELKIIAVTGWTTLDLINAINNVDLVGSYDIVTLMIGVNDQFHGLGIDLYEINLEKLLKFAIDAAGDKRSRVIVISIPDYSVTPNGKKYHYLKDLIRIDEFNISNKRIAENKEVKYVNVTEISRKLANDPKFLASDELHPSAKMYSEWVKFILPKVLCALSEN